MRTKIEQYSGEEIFIICSATSDSPFGVLRVFDGFIGPVQVIQALSEYTLAETPDLRVLHGVLRSAEFLPQSLRSVTAYLVVENKTMEEMGVVIESSADTPEQLAAELSTVLENIDGLDLGGAESIDDLFILYGYEVDICLTIDKESIDEEVIDRAIAISEEAEKTKEVAVSEFYQ
jgi:hypothetical protein